ncbi:hypothetical protein CRG98_016574 [Punica granatum]|uniref:G-patch domain-containing protein n=1 Tax=Punica granatum TaxID=22663 RepID=A0A2I0K4I1_PUNGR|nr:hypothetical protein CRG98_016574 [Punica granatum]
MAKSPAHISLLALLLGSEPHREALLRVLTAAQVPKGTSPDRIEETISSIFSSTISFSDDELPSKGCAHSRALHIVCKCNNHIVGRVMIDNGSALNVCPVTTLKQMNVDLNRVRPSKTTVRAFDGSWREVNGEIDLLIEVDPCSFSVTFQVFDIPNAFSLLLGRPWIHSAGAVPSSLHQKLKFIVEERLITVKGEEDYAIYKETAVPYISVGNDENLPFHSFETISVIRNYGEVGPSRADRMIGKVLLRHNYIPGTGLGARGQGISRPIEVEELHSNPNHRHVDSNPFEECLGEPRRVYFGEGLDEDSQVPEIEESLHRLEDRQLTSVEPTEEINVGTEDVPRNLKIGTGLDPTQRARMIDFLTRYQEVFAWSYADMPGLDPSIRAMVTLFHDMMHKEVEVYVNDMIAKFKEGEDHLVNLKRLFDRLKEYKLRLNPAKCKFGARSGKLLGFVVSERGIEVDPDKVKAIRELPPSSSAREAIADHLAEFPIEDNTPIDPNFPDEGILQVDYEGEKPEWKMYFDGVVNSTGSGIGAVLISPDGRYYPVAAKIDFPCTNNVAEYEACILGLQAAIDFKVKELEVFGDSMLTIFQTLGQWKTKDAKLVPYHEYLERLTENFEDISFTNTLRMNNQFADALAMLASMVSITKENLIEPLEIEITKGPAHCNAIEASEAKPWYEDIKNFLRTGQCPPFADRRDRKTLRRLAIHYFLSGEVLYRRSFDSTLLRCIDEHESRRLMEEVHGGNCGPHMNDLMLAKKIMRLGYYWSTMETDCVKHVRHCHRCQVYADQIKAPPNELRPMTAP